MNIDFGVMAPPLHVQLNCRPKKVEKQHNDNTAINRLCVRGLLTEAETRNARKRLVKNLETILNAK